MVTRVLILLIFIHLFYHTRVYKNDNILLYLLRIILYVPSYHCNGFSIRFVTRDKRIVLHEKQIYINTSCRKKSLTK